MKTRNGTEAPEGRPSGVPGASSKAAARRGSKMGKPANRQGKPASPKGQKGASPSAASAATRRDPQPKRRPGKPNGSGKPKGVSPAAGPAETARMRRDGPPGPANRRRGAPRCRGEADRASPDPRDPEAVLRRILREVCPADPGAEGRPARSATRSEHPDGSKGGGAGPGSHPRTGRRRRGDPVLGRGLADFPVSDAGQLNSGLERLLGPAAKRAFSRRPRRANSPRGSGGNRPVPAPKCWGEPLSGVPDPIQAREALDVFVKLTMHRAAREVAATCKDTAAFGVGHMLWSMARRGILADEATAFVTLRTVFGAESDAGSDGDGEVLPCNRRTVIHTLRHLGLLDPALSVRVVKPGHVMPDLCDVLTAVAVRFAVPAREIRGTCRSKPIIAARFAVMAVQREITGVSYGRIGRDLGGRHHSSVTHAIASVVRRRQEDPELDRTLTACADSADNAAVERHLDALRGMHQPVCGR